MDDSEQLLVVNEMDFGKTVSDSLAYAQEGLVGKWVKWVLLIISTIIFPLMLGYVVRILKGATPSPELEDWGGMFIDGIKLFIVALIYAIPVIILEVIAMGSIFAAAASGDPTAAMAGIAGAGLYSWYSSLSLLLSLSLKQLPTSVSQGPEVSAKHSTLVRSLPTSARSAGCPTLSR